MSKERFRPYCAVYLILKEGEKFLFHRRKNTGWEDRKYQMISGHVEDGESARESLRREIVEEAGIDVLREDMKHVFTCYRKGPKRIYVDIYFETKAYKGEPKTMEPHKAEDTGFIDVKEKQNEVVEYNKFALEEIEKGMTYGEFGW